MKQIKFLVMALAMVMGLTMTSCLETDNGPQQFSGYVKVVSFMGYSYFEDLAGNKYYPTSTSLADMKANMGFEMSTSHFVFLQYQLAETEGANTKADSGETGKQEFSITLSYAVALDGPQPITVATAEELETAAPEVDPIVSFGTENAFLGTPFYYNTEYIYMPVVYNVKKAGKNEKQEDVIKMHTINLAWVSEETAADATELVLYLRHDRDYEYNTDEDGKVTDTKAQTLSYGAYDIRSIMEAFRIKTGNYPEEVTVKVHETADYGMADEMPEDYTTYTSKAEPFSLFKKNY